MCRYIQEFVSGGPKNHSEKTNTGKTSCTVKGYAINYLTNLILNFDSIKACIDDHSKELVIPQLRFIKNKSDWQIKTCIQNKVYNCITYDKRLLMTDGSTLPFGYLNKNK